MCGIFGYAGESKEAGQIVFEGLKKLEYRGYDSWGVATADLAGQRLEIRKEVGHIGSAQPKFPQSRISLGQTRWATHGGVTKINAHPHLDCSSRLALVHNGIVENYQEIKLRLKKSHTFKSQTDTEIIVHLIEEYLKHGKSLAEAARLSFREMAGLNAFVVLDVKGKTLVAAKAGSPLVVGLGKTGNYIASDSLGVLPHTNSLIFLEDGQMGVLEPGCVKIFDVSSGREVKPRVSNVSWHSEEENLGEYQYFIQKEINEQPKVLESVIKNKGLEVSHLSLLIKRSFGTYLVGCGTASYACLSGVYFFNGVARRHVNFSIGSEFNYLLDFVTPKSLVVAVSQSGETLDVIESVGRAKKRGAKIGSLVNVTGSTLFRLSDYPVLIGAGQERAVISTKAFCAQVAILLYTAYATAGQAAKGQSVLKSALASLQKVLSDESQERIKSLARKLKDSKHIYIIGRGVSYPAALECALKIKEAAYIHAEGFAGGELKHGVIALIEKGKPCIVLAPEDETHGATLAGAMEIKARGGYIIGLSSKNGEVFDDFIEVPAAGPASVIPNVAVAQTLAYYLALLKGYDPDKPRNLAKSVTVK